MQNAEPKRKKHFVPRTSRLDSMEGDSSMGKSELKGFYNLVSIALTAFFIQQQIVYIRSEGTLVGMDRASLMFNRHDLFPAWVVLVGSTFIAVGLQKLKLKKIIPINSPLDVLLQLAIFVLATMVAWEREWGITQTGFFVAEMIVLLMKVHSYIMTNRYYTKLYFQEKKDDDVTAELGEFPKNVTFSNFIFFLIIPTLCYELEYPRTKNIRIFYLLEKFMSFVGLWSVLHVLTSKYIVPVLESPQLSVVDAILELLLPFLVESLLIFYLVFDVICNSTAELTRFGDREFYSDWWNSSNFDDWSRKWNKPVHDWLRRHVYEETLKSQNSKMYAALFTFVLSSIFHEYFLTMLMRVFKPYLFFFQMLQFPLIIVFSKMKFLRETRIGNLFFWFSMTLGPPMITILYCREVYVHP